MDLKKGKTFYRMSFGASENGLAVFTEELYSIRETEHVHFCVTEREFRNMHGFSWDWKEGETPIQFAKRRRIKVHRINKDGSRVAFDTKEKAFDQLRWLKSRQIRHMEREMEFLRRFLADTEGGFNGSGLVNSNGRLIPSPDIHILPGTRDLVHHYLVFE